MHERGRISFPLSQSPSLSSLFIVDFPSMHKGKENIIRILIYSLLVSMIIYVWTILFHLLLSLLLMSVPTVIVF